MADRTDAPEKLRFVWVYPDSLAQKLNSAPTLNMTREMRLLGWQANLLVGTPDQSGPFMIQDVEAYGIRRPNKFLVRQLVYHIQALKYLLAHWNETDVILFTSLSTPWIVPLRLVRFFRGGKGPRLVMDTRTVPMEGNQGTIKDRLRGWADYLMADISNRYADGQTMITPQMAEVLRVPPDKLWGCWPSGVNIERFLPAMEARRWPQGDEPVQIIYVGIFSLERDLGTLCRAVEKANQEGMCFELTLVGDGRDRENLVAFASQTQGRVRVLDRVPHDQVPTVLSKAHLGALPFPDEMKFRVSSFIKMFEYLGAGLPVLATRIQAHTDVIGDQPCAFWAEDATVGGLVAALREAWKNRVTLPQMGQVAADLSHEYTWTASARKLSAALQRGLSKNGKAGAAR